MIEVIEYTPVQQGKTVAVFSVYLKKMDMVIRGIRLVQNEGRSWYNFPCRGEEQPDGSKKWIPYLEFRDNATKDRWHKSVSQAIDAYVKQPKSEPVEEDLPF